MSLKYEPLSYRALTQLQFSLKGIEYIIIDEIFAVSNFLFGYLILRLCNLSMPKHRLEEFQIESIDNFNFILVGDLGQLSPVKQNYLFDPTPSQNETGGISNLGYAFYMSINTMFMLTSYLRFFGSTETSFLEILKRIWCRDRSSIEVDYHCLKKRFIFTPLEDPQIIHIYTKNSDVDYHNKFFLSKLKNIMTFNAEFIRNPKNESPPDMPLQLKLAIGCRIMLTRNLSIEKGLFNGRMGTIVDIHSKGIHVLFDGDGSIEFVPPVEYHWLDKSANHCVLMQLPIKLAWAITVHKSQGMTLDNGVIDIGDREFANGITYVALSRFRNLDCFYLKPFTLERFKAAYNHTLQFIKIDEELKRIKEKSEIEVMKKNPFLLKHEQNSSFK